MLFTPKLHSCTDRAYELVDKEDKADGLLDRANDLLDKDNGPLDKKSRATCSRNGEESKLLFLTFQNFSSWIATLTYPLWFLLAHL